MPQLLSARIVAEPEAPGAVAAAPEQKSSSTRHWLCARPTIVLCAAMRCQSAKHFAWSLLTLELRACGLAVNVELLLPRSHVQTESHYVCNDVQQCIYNVLQRVLSNFNRLPNLH